MTSDRPSPYAPGTSYGLCGSAVPSWLIAFLGSGTTVLLCLLWSPDFHHWFVVPVLLCGCLTGIPGVSWLRGRLPLFDAVGVVGVYGIYFFFLSPLLHVLWNWWLPFVVPPDDWRPWIGWMACINAVGLAVYLTIVIPPTIRPSGRCSRTVWLVEPSRLYPALAILTALSVGLQAFVYYLFGGVSGFLAVYDRQPIGGDLVFHGYGFVFMFSEMAPTLGMIAYVVHTARIGSRPSWKTLGLVLFAFVIAKVFFGGLRGSRANYVWPLFWAVGLIHLWIRPLSRKAVFAGLAILVGFMYVYGFYKSYGTQAVQAIRDRNVREELESDSHRSIEATLLGDFGRADVQAFLAYRLCQAGDSEDFPFGWGRTYLGAVALVVPAWIWPDRPETKVKEGTEALFGRNPVAGIEVASNAYGLAGEAMLNFGLPGAACSFVVLALVVGGLQRGIGSLQREDSRNLLVPFLVSLCFYVLVWDSDVVFFYLITSGVIPACLVLWGSRRCLIADVHPARREQLSQEF